MEEIDRLTYMRYWEKQPLEWDEWMEYHRRAILFFTRRKRPKEVAAQKDMLAHARYMHKKTQAERRRVEAQAKKREAEEEQQARYNRQRRQRGAAKTRSKRAHPTGRPS